ncbi:MAG: tyrosine--tRNA ligase, partial [Propionibacteriaceae bacterium]|nr:tyrosine--tRNA ligase [Propionibacteriaceae bacterium]
AMQRAGHRPILLVGGSTGLIGDPKQAGERTMNPKEQVATWVERISEQVSRMISFDGSNGAILVNNYDWTAE